MAEPHQPLEQEGPAPPGPTLTKAREGGHDRARPFLRAGAATGSFIWKAQINWKYTPTGPHTGVLQLFQVMEEFQRETLRESRDIRWSSKNEFESTTTFHLLSRLIGQQLRFVRDYYPRDGIR